MQRLALLTCTSSAAYAETAATTSMATGGRGAAQEGNVHAASYNQRHGYARQSPYSRLPVASHQQYSLTNTPSHSPIHGSMTPTTAMQGVTHHAGPSRYHPRATIIIIGMKGAGKVSRGEERAWLRR